MAADPSADAATGTEKPAATAPAQAAPAQTGAKPEAKKTPSPKKDGTESSSTAQQTEADKKLSGAEMKALKKAEKAAARAKAKGDRETTTPAKSSGKAPSGGGDNKQTPKKGGKQDAPQPPASKSLPVRSAQGTTSTAVPVKDDKAAIPASFSHLPMAKRVIPIEAAKEVHPTVLAVGQQMGAFELKEPISRLHAMLSAFREVINSYKTPAGTTLSRHFTPHVLGPQISYLTECRPMCYAMGNAIRWLKLQVSKIDIDMPDDDAKKILCDAIDTFILNRIKIPNFLIVKEVAGTIYDGDTIITYGHSRLVERTLRQAKVEGRDFAVIIVEDPFDRSGIELARILKEESGITASYCPSVASIASLVKPGEGDDARVLLGAEAIFSNGAVYARAGTADLTLLAKEMQIRVGFVCEMIAFTERLAIDSMAYNEIDPNRCTADDFALLFDTTRADCVTHIISEFGIATPMNVPYIIRKLEDL